MTDDSFRTTRYRELQARIEAGDAAARDELLRHVGDRLVRLTRRMLRQFPRVSRCVETDDVFQGAVLRLLRSLREVRPDSVRAFFGLAARQVRRELIDLARHFRGPRGPVNGQGGHSYDAPDAAAGPADLMEWQEFHEQIGRLPEEEREALDLMYYQGLPQAETAALLGVSVRTVQRRWQAALLRLHDALGGEWPKA